MMVSRSLPPQLTRRHLASGELAGVQDRVLTVARSLDWEGYSKHDALNASWLERLAGDSRILRLVSTQLVMRAPIHLRPAIGVARARNAKGLALFARALLARRRVLGDEDSARDAEVLLDWLIDHPSDAVGGLCWGYPYPWQDVGFFAPRHLPNRVVTANVVHALLDGWETLGHERWLDAAGRGVSFLVKAPRTLFEDERRRCVSYVPAPDVTWIVMDVSALAGAATARYAAHRGDPTLMEEGGRLVRYVASKQSGYGAWYYADPPGASHIGHDNYHTGIILDALLDYRDASGSDEFLPAWERGLAFYREALFREDGAPMFMSDQRYPYDIHGAAQGIITFSRAEAVAGATADIATRVLRWTLQHMYDSRTGWFYYQKHRWFRTRIQLLRWCQAWMAHALGVYLERMGEWD